MRIERTLPPVGYRFPVKRVGRALAGSVRSRPGRDRFEEELTRFVGVREAVAVSSGKAALTVILRALTALSGRTTVIVPAYTCYSLPAAISRAGLQVAVCDTAAGSFDYDFERLEPMLGPDVLCVLSVHLFGILSDTPRLRTLCAARGIFVVEDAAQALGAHDGGAMAGTRGDVGFFSLGRGKNVTCGNGGVILTSSDSIAGEIRHDLAGTAAHGAAKAVRTSLTLLMMGLFVAPAVYWLPAGLPFLRIGETIYDPGFAIGRLSNFEARLLHGWHEDLAALNAIRREHGRVYRQRFADAPAAPPGVAYLRFPLLMAGDEQRRHLLHELNGTALGLSSMYPTPVDRIPALAGAVEGGPFPNAERLARGLVTLPTHPLVSDRDRDRICAVVDLARRRTHAGPSAQVGRGPGGQLAGDAAAGFAVPQRNRLSGAPAAAEHVVERLPNA